MFNLSTHLSFNAEQWSRLKADIELRIESDELDDISGFNDQISIKEVSSIYLPLSRLLSLYFSASNQLYRAGDTFLGRLPGKVPFVIGIAGSVAVGKTTAARVLQKLLQRWPSKPRVDLVTTDGFLYPNSYLESKNLMNRKGFPESYDRKSLLEFLYKLKSGEEKVYAPKYSHLTYDVVDDSYIEISRPDILILEGLTVLQPGSSSLNSQVYVSDFIDFSIYLHADVLHLKNWYIDRFLALKRTAFKDENSYFHKYRDLSDEEAVDIASDIWVTINEKNLYENILPTKDRADLILTKCFDHLVDNVQLRRL